MDPLYSPSNSEGHREEPFVARFSLVPIEKWDTALRTGSFQHGCSTMSHLSPSRKSCWAENPQPQTALHFCSERPFPLTCNKFHIHTGCDLLLISVQRIQVLTLQSHWTQPNPQEKPSTIQCLVCQAPPQTGV